MSASPAVPLRVALDTVIQTSTFFAGDKAYLEGSDALRGAPLPYVVYGTSVETYEGQDRFNGQRRHENILQLKCWGADKDEAERGYAELKSKVDEVALTVTGHGTAKGRLSKIADLAEPNPEIGGHQVIARYRIVLQAA